MKKILSLLFISVLFTACSSGENPNKLTVEDFQNVTSSNAQVEEQQQVIRQIVAEGALDRCQNISDVNFRSQCVANIAFNQSLETKNPALCDQIEEQDLRSICAMQVNSEL